VAKNGSDRYAVTGDSLQAYLKKIEKIPLLTREEEVDLATLAQEGDQDALDKLIRSNLRYVVSVARKYIGCGLSLADLINEGNIGLIQAAKRFDPTRGVKFITYAVWWIRQAIMHALAEQGGTVRLPLKQMGTLHKIAENYRQYIHRTGVEPTSTEIGKELDMPPEEVETILRVYRSYLSLDAPISNDGDVSHLDLLQSKTLPSVEETYIKSTLTEEISELLSQIPAREQRILRLRFGFDDEPKTLEEIGKMLGLSRERVRQIEKRAKDLLRAKAKTKALKDYLN
jgi:RNA polymerase primary sigma factor